MGSDEGHPQLEVQPQLYLFQLQEEVLCGAPFAEGPEEPLIGRADTDLGLQEEPDRLLNFCDHQIHSGGQEQSFVWGERKPRQTSG